MKTIYSTIKLMNYVKKKNMIQNNSDVGADSNWGTTFRRGLENWGEGARVSTVLDSGGGKFSKRQKKNQTRQRKRKKKHSFRSLLQCLKWTVAKCD